MDSWYVEERQKDNWTEVQKESEINANAEAERINSTFY